MTDLLQHLRIAAVANRLANHRLHAAMARLSREDFHAPRTSFFPSLALTLNHILVVDVYYIDALEGVAAMEANYRAFVPADTVTELEPRQRASDERLIAYCERLHDADAPVAMDRGRGNVQRDLAGHVLAHLFMHQTHHRGQAHAMLSGTVKPPQLDEFLMPSDARFREADMRALGFSEAAIYGRSARAEGAG
jgi:uncharacterized damage-inducible protein DinB